MKPEPKWLRMKFAQSLVGQSTTMTVKEAFELGEVKGQMPKTAGIAYELLSLKWYTDFWAAGAGWSYVLNWALSRSSTPKSSPAGAYNMISKIQDLIFEHQAWEGDSYASPSHVERNSEAVANFHYFQPDCRPICLKLPKFYGGLFIYYDGVGGRAWSVDVVVNIEYRILQVSDKDYQHYERAYGLQGV